MTISSLLLFLASNHTTNEGLGRSHDDAGGIPGWPPENIEEMAKKLEQEMLG